MDCREPLRNDERNRRPLFRRKEERHIIVTWFASNQLQEASAAVLAGARKNIAESILGAIGNSMTIDG
jgi:hypothetical protein